MKKSFIPLWLANVAAALTLAAPLEAKDIHEPGETLYESQAKVETVLPDLYAVTPISQAAFVFDLTRDDFDLTAFLDRQAPHLKEEEEAILHWSGFASIHPRVVLALMEARTSVVTRPTRANLKRPFGTLSVEVGFKEQLADVVTRLSQRYYNLESQRQATGPSMLGQPRDAQQSSATQALASAAVESSRSHRAGDPLAAFTDSYSRLFPEAAATLQSPGISKEPDNTEQSPSQASFVPPSNLMQLPWRQGYWWIPNGAHSHTGSGYPFSSIDVSYNWPWWYGRTYSVAAAHSGTVRVFSRCQVRVTHPSGWATNYYHLEGIQVRNGQWVGRNTKLANYASNRGTALCQGGSSTGPHLHFSLLYNGRYHSLHGVNLGPYKVDVGRYNYDDNCSSFWLYNEYRRRRECAWTSIYNYGARN